MSEYEPIPVSLPPGIVKGQSNQVARDRYVDCNLVRFWRGKPQRWDGWTSYVDGVLGEDDVGEPARGAVSWVALDGTPMLAWGTPNNLWLLRNGVLIDITPAGLPEGYTDTQGSVGWNEGGWNEGGWGGELPIGESNGGRARTWSLALWGEDLLANPRGGGIYRWAYTSGSPGVAEILPDAPESVLAIIVTDDRHLVALGASTGSSPSVVQSPLRIAWADRETLDDWTPSAENTAGDLLLESGNEIIGHAKTRGGHIIMTDTSAHTFNIVGGDDVFGVDRRGSSVGLIAPHAIVESNGVSVWMSDSGFHSYDGVVRELPSDVHDYVFRNLNKGQKFKICAGVNSKYGEILFFYPHGTSIENNRYVAFNSDGWTVGELARTTWIDSSAAVRSPIATDPSGNVYRHENGDNANGAPLEYSLSTGDVGIAIGGTVAASENISRLRTVVPDMERLSGEHYVTIEARKRPMATHSMVKGPYSYDAETSAFGVKARGRSFRFTFTGNGDFRFGDILVYGVPDGGR